MDPHADADYGEGGFNRVDDDLSLVSNGVDHAPKSGPIVIILGDREGRVRRNLHGSFLSMRLNIIGMCMHGGSDGTFAIEAIDNQAYRFGQLIEGQIPSTRPQCRRFYAIRCI